MMKKGRVRKINRTDIHNLYTLKWIFHVADFFSMLPENRDRIKPRAAKILTAQDRVALTLTAEKGWRK